MKTAVDYLVETLAEKGIIHSSDISKAKEMEKQQIIDAAKYGNSFEQGDLRCEVYYNETFKTDKG